MGYRSQTGSRRGSGQKFQKSQHEKAKAKGDKHRSGGKYLEEETPLVTAEEVAEKAVGSLNKLGSQVFAVSPFNEYFDDWLVNLREVLAEFESSSAISVDDQFVKERSQIFTDTERELAERRVKEAALEEAAKALSENNHALMQIDAEYAAKTRENGVKRNTEIERLTRNVHDLEAELDKVRQTKTSFFGFTKKAKVKKMAEKTQKLNPAKSELELAVQNFTVEQEKLHDDYEKRKQVVIEKVRALEKEVENIETDSSLAVRQAACHALVNAVNALLKRKAASPQ